MNRDEYPYVCRHAVDFDVLINLKPPTSFQVQDPRCVPSQYSRHTLILRIKSIVNRFVVSRHARPLVSFFSIQRRKERMISA